MAHASGSSAVPAPLPVDLPALAIHAAIQRLKAEFTLAVDQKRWNDFTELFTPDARIDYSRTRRSWDQGDGLVYTDPRRFADDVAAMLADARTVHHAVSPLIDVIDDHHARAVWRMEDIVQRPAGAPRPGGHGYGLYDEEYRLTPAGWRIAALTFTRLTVLPVPAC